MKGIDLLVWRKRHGYTQTKLGKLLGVGQDTVSDWETGKRDVPPHVEARLPSTSDQPKARVPIVFKTHRKADGGAWYVVAKSGSVGLSAAHPRNYFDPLGHTGPVYEDMLEDENYKNWAEQQKTIKTT